MSLDWKRIRESAHLPEVRGALQERMAGWKKDQDDWSERRDVAMDRYEEALRLQAAAAKHVTDTGQSLHLCRRQVNDLTAQIAIGENILRDTPEASA